MIEFTWTEVMILALGDIGLVVFLIMIIKLIGFYERNFKKGVGKKKHEK